MYILLTRFVCSTFNANSETLIRRTSGCNIWLWHRYCTHCKIITVYCRWCIVVRLWGIWTMGWRWLRFSIRHMVWRWRVEVGRRKHFKNLFGWDRPFFPRAPAGTDVTRTITIATRACVKIQTWRVHLSWSQRTKTEHNVVHD